MAGLQSPLKKDDNVVVIAGRDRGKKGRVLVVEPSRNRVVVEGVNVIKRHTKPNPQRNIKGGIVEREASIYASKVQIVCPQCSAPARIGYQLLEDGRKVRVCRKCKGVVDR